MSGEKVHDLADLQRMDKHLRHMADALLSLTGRKEGDLTPGDVKVAVAKMAGKGLFSEPGQLTAVIDEMAKLPEDEKALRRYLGMHLISTHDHRAHVQSLIAREGA